MQTTTKFASTESKPISQETGAIMVEASVSLWLFVLLSIGTVVLIWFLWTNISLNFAIAKAARWGILGLVVNDPQTGEPLSRVESFRARFNIEARKLGLASDDVTIRLCPIEDPNCPVSSAGAPGSMIVINAEKPIMQLGGTNLALRASASLTMINE